MAVPDQNHFIGGDFNEVLPQSADRKKRQHTQLLDRDFVEAPTHQR